MRYLLLILSLIALTFQANAQQTEWNLVFPSHKSPPMAIKDIASLDSLHAYIVGDFPRIGSTADGGKSWQYTTVNAPESDSAADFTSIHFTDALHGWAASGRSGIARTEDGGKTWQWGSGAFKHISSIMVWEDMTFVDALHGWAVGKWKSKDLFSGMVTRTNDGGKTWTTWAIDTNLSELKTCAFLNKNIGIATGACNWLLRTSDGGVSWQRMLPIGKYEIVNYANIMPDGSFAVLNHNGVLRSNDKGLTWILDTVVSQKYHSFIRFSDSLHGVSIPKEVYFLSPKYLITNDGGKTWVSKHFPLGVSEWLHSRYLLSSTAAPDGSLWISGGRGMILRSTDAGNTWKNLAGYSDAFTSITFNSPLSGWISISNNYNLLLHTLDGGKTWKPHFPVDTLRYISDGPFFLDGNTGWYFEEQGGYGNGMILKKTTDNGVTWTEIKSGNMPSRPNTFFIINDSTFVTTSDGTLPNDHKLISKDGGKNWIDSRNVHKQDSVEFWDIYMQKVLYEYKKVNLVTGLGIIQYDIGKVRTTTNSGKTWKTTPLSPSMDTQKIVACIIDSNHWWVVGGYTYLACTTDGGVTWKDYTSKLNLNGYAINRIEFSDKYNGVITVSGKAEGSLIYVTTDGGESWKKTSIELLGEYPIKNIRDFTAASNGTFWICGDNGLLINWKPSITNVDEQSATPTSDRISIYPNPTSTSFTISGVDNVSSVRIVNSLGVEVLYIREINSKQEINISSLPNGLYFVKYATSKEAFTKPIIISR